MKRDKNKKPYVVCIGCGVQVFFRGKAGIQRLGLMTGCGELARNVRDLSPLLNYVAFLRHRLREIRQTQPIFGKDPDLEIEEKVVRSELDRLQKLMRGELAKRKRKRGASGNRVGHRADDNGSSSSRAPAAPLRCP
jgi:hypothetical protein